MRNRGRPPKSVGERRYPNRLRDLRVGLGLPQRSIAATAGISLAYYGALERGDKRINADTAERLRRALQCTAGDLLGGAGLAATAPLRYWIAAAESESRPDSFDLPEPWERLSPARLADAAGCIAAEIADDSADLDFARATVLFLRPVPSPAATLRLGVRVVCRFFADPATGDRRRTQEILYGILDQTIFGDLVLITRSRNRLLPRHALIQPMSSAQGAVAEAPLVLRRADATIPYQFRLGDPGELLGQVVYAAGPA
jgi:transcriptional regulator with XRE-family HTH domain